jgi:hypothetical protein
MSDEKGFTEDKGCKYGGHEKGDRQDGRAARKVFHRSESQKQVGEEGGDEVH